MPIPSTYAQVAEILRNMAEHVAAGDSFEGSIEYSIPTAEDALPPPASDDDQPEVLVRAVYRIGNTMGQGGYRIVGTMNQ